MQIKPILFNTEMVRAILDGRKTQTRRIVQQKYGNTHLEMFTNKYGTRLVELQNEEEGVTIIHNPDGSTTHRLLAMIEKEPPYRRGEILWVRETWVNLPVSPGGHMRIMRGRYYYRADVPDIRPDGWKGNWKPSIHMPKEAARIFLQVESVRPERLQSIREDDAMKEGVEKGPSGLCPYISGFIPVWENTIKAADLNKCGWDANPWVWVIEFERIERLEGWPNV